MKKLLPIDPPLRTPRSELKVREAFKGVDNVVVLHSVAWQGIRRGRQADGEADFIVLVPGKGIAILEVKGGQIDLQDGRWFSTDSGGARHSIKNPFEQAKDSKYALVNYFKEVQPSLAHVPVVHGVVFSDIVFDERLGMSGPRELVIDQNGLLQLHRALPRLFDYWNRPGRFDQEQLERVVDLLAPTISLAPPLLHALEVANRGITELTQQQIALLNGLRRNRHATILGGAGTGKTVLAVDKACRLAAEGHRVALVCFNTLLRNEIAALFPLLNVEILTFHGLVREWMRKAKLPVPGFLDDTWFQEHAAKSLGEAAGLVNERYDAMLIDEAQDFATEWLDACQTTVVPDGIFYVFADARQDLYKRDWAPRKSAIAFELSINCRNTVPIARLVASVFEEDVCDRGIEGPPPIFLCAETNQDAIRLCQKTVDNLLSREKLSTTQLAVLSDSRDVVRRLRESIVADIPFCAAGEDGVVAETVYRFKGLEREVVVVALTAEIDTTNALELLYVALSRARAALWVIGGKHTISRLQNVASTLLDHHDGDR
jgi:RecA/RadA recombinase